MCRIVAMVLFSALLGSAWRAPAWGASYTFTTIDVPDSTFTAATGINDVGQIVGVFGEFPVGDRSFLLSGGRFTPIPHFVGDAHARGINNSGQIVGSGGSFPLSFLLSGGRFTLIQSPSVLTYTRALGINDAGQIVGRIESYNPHDPY